MANQPAQQLPRVDLWVKVGHDGVRNGGCPVCHQIFMLLLTKAKNGALNFDVKTTYLHKPHAEFKATGARHVPVLVHDGEAFSTPEEILAYIDTAFPKGSMQYFNPEADAACENVFAKFCWYLKEVSKDPIAFNHELAKLDAYIKGQDPPLRFLCSDNLCHLDCHMLPKLHHVRVAGGYLKDYKIPAEFTGVWSYMRNGYQNENFLKSCPSDQEIILHWADRPDTRNLTAAQVAELANQEPKFSVTIPDEVKLN